MARTKRYTHHLPLCISIALAVSAFCYWYFLCPHLLLAREQTQLFLWTSSYLTERMIIPGGLAQYLGEMLTQFFIFPQAGALIYAVLFVLSQWLTWKLIKRFVRREKAFRYYPLSLIAPIALWYLANNIYVPMTLTVAIVLTLAIMALLPSKGKARLPILLILIPVGYWLVGPAIVLLLLCHPRWSPLLAVLLALCIIASAHFTPYPLRQVARGIDYYWEEPLLGTKEEMKYDMLLRSSQWEKIVDLYRSEQPPSLACQNAAALALYHTGHINQQHLSESLELSGQTLRSQTSAIIMSEIYMLLSMNNMSQRAAFEAMEAIPNHNKSGRVLRRLAETNLISGHYDVVLKYLSILDESTFYRSWSEKLRPLALHPKKLKAHPTYARFQDIYQKTNDEFFN